MILADAHVHIYDCFDLGKFFDSAYENFKSEAEKLNHTDDFTGILLLAETAKENWFQHLCDYADGQSLPGNKSAGTWKFYRTDEGESLYAQSGKNGELILIAGRQHVTAENLELLALATVDPCIEKRPIEKLIESVQIDGAIPVIPWGVGKWFGSRGAIVRRIINSDKKDSVYIGDNGNRPYFWRRPTLFKLAEKKGISILPGSDPLPFISEGLKAGSFGFSFQNSINIKTPASHIKQLLMNPKHQINRFGRLENTFKFFLNQMQTHFVKRDLKALRLFRNATFHGKKYC